MRVTGIETVALRDPAAGLSATLVLVRTDAGLVGIGQAEAPSLVIDALVRCEGGLAEVLHGEDATQVQRLWQKMYSATGFFGRRGVAIAAIGAVEMALWDVTGQALGRPVCDLIWRACCTTRTPVEVKSHVVPYATVYPPGETIDEVRRRFREAADRGFRAVKLEPWPGGFGTVDAETDAAVVGAVRDAVGPECALMVDVCEHWPDVGRAVAGVRAIEPFDVYFVEAPLAADSLEGYARLAEAVPGIRVAAGDWGFTTRFEFESLLSSGVGVVQPSTVRSGGLAEILTIAESAYRRGALCVPHSWCHMVGVAASVHMAAVLPNMPYLEYPIAHPDSPIVSELLKPTLEPDADGRIAVPRRPGLGFRLNPRVLDRYRVAPF